MRTNKRFLSPPFLDRFDERLLLNKPDAWSARAHLVLYYGGLFILLLALLCYVFPDDPRSPSGLVNWMLFTSIITIIGLVVYLIYLLRFNVFKRYGSKTGGARLQSLLLYFVSIGLIITIPFVQSGVESARANAAYDDDELVQDVNNINTKIVQLEHDSLEHRWTRDTVRVVDTIPGQTRDAIDEYEEPVEVTVPASTDGRRMRVIDTASFRIELTHTDSTEKINDSTWILLTAPTYVFTSVSGLEPYTQLEQYSSADIYYRVVRDYKQPDRKRVRAELDTLIQKYRTDYQEYMTTDYYYGAYDHLRTVNKRYHINELDYSLRNISNRKNLWRGSNVGDWLRSFFYITLCLSLLVFLFRHTTVRTFFLSLLTICLLTILSALILAFGGFTAVGVFSLMLFYFVLFIGISATAWMNKVRHVVTGISINLFVLMLPFVPLIIVGLYHAIQEMRYNARNMSFDTEQLRPWYGLAEIAGPALLLILTATYIHRLYRRWYALPED